MNYVRTVPSIVPCHCIDSLYIIAYLLTYHIIFSDSSRPSRDEVRLLSWTVHRHHVHNPHPATDSLLRIQPHHSMCAHFNVDATHLYTSTGRRRKNRPRYVLRCMPEQRDMQQPLTQASSGSILPQTQWSVAKDPQRLLWTFDRHDVIVGSWCTIRQCMCRGRMINSVRFVTYDMQSYDVCGLCNVTMKHTVWKPLNSRWSGHNRHMTS